MINILIVDDNQKRYRKLREKISAMPCSQQTEIEICDSADEARLLLRNISFDLMILDVVLPKKNQDTPTSKTGLKLLQDINSGDRYITPLKIIGITAYIEDMGEYTDLFELYTSVVLKAPYNSQAWMNKITMTIDNIVNMKTKRNITKKESILITLHGIRTFGNWQEEIQKTISKNTQNFEFHSIKYGFFSFFAFILPFLWSKILKDTSFALEKIIDSNEDKDIHIIAHSFGTYVIVKFMSEKKYHKKIKTLILAGSVLPSDYLSKIDIAANVERFINECGTKDYVLLVNKFFIWGLEDAGRIGFTMANSSNMCNRYFDGGHSLYFNQEFYRQYWLPILLTDVELDPIDNRKYKWYTDFTEFIYAVLNKFKYFWYIGGFVWFIIFIFDLKLTLTF